MPKRIQRKRTKGWRMPPNTVYVGRPGEFGNPYTVGPHVAAKRSVEWFRFELEMALEGDPTPRRFARMARLLEGLRGKDLACWCRLDQPCHADVLLELANQPQPDAIDRARRAWNATADEHNQWDSLGGDERAELIQAELANQPQP